MRRNGIVKRAISVILAVSLIASSGAMSVLAEESMPEEPAVIEMADESEPDAAAETQVPIEPEVIDESAEIIAADPADEMEVPAEEPAAAEEAVEAEEAAPAEEPAAAEEAAPAEEPAAAEETAPAEEPAAAEEVVVEETEPVVEEDPEDLLVLSVEQVEEVPIELLDDEPVVIDDEDEVIYGTMTMSYQEFYDGLVYVEVDAVSSATTGYNTSFSHADTGEVDGSSYMINGVKDVPVEVFPDASDELKERVTPLEDGESYDQYWIVDEDGITANLNVVDTVRDAEPELVTNSHWADYELEVNENSTSYIRNSRSDEGFKVNSNLLGVVIGTSDGAGYGLWHLRNFWLQPYLIGFNADEQNVAGLVGKTITSVTYIMPDETYVYEFSEGVYVKEAYTGEIVTGEFNEDATQFTLNEIPGGLTNPMLSITYSTGSSYHKETHTLLEVSLENVTDGTTFDLTDVLPEDTVPTVQILSDDYAQIDVSYPMFKFQEDELTALVAKGREILGVQEDPHYNYSLLAEHVEEGQDVLANGDAAEAADIISELGELVEEARVIYGTMTMSYEEFYDGKVSDTVDAVSSATTGHSTSFAHADKGEVTDTDFMIYGVTGVPVKVLPSASSDVKARVTELEEGISYNQYWLVGTDDNGSDSITANLDIIETVDTAELELVTNSHWADYELEVNETTETKLIRNTRSDDGFAVNSELMGAIIGTEEGDSYGLWHLRNIWLQPYLLGFNAGEENTDGLVGETINSVTYIMEDGSYEFTFEEGIYVKPAYDGETPTGEFNDDATEFTLNEIPEGLTNPVLSITYSTGSSYNKTTHTLLNASLTEETAGTTFTLDEELPEDTVPTVQILSDNYAQIDVSYPMFQFQRDELEALVAEGLTILDEQKVDGYNYGMLEEHVAEGQDVLANGDAAEAADIIDELGELIEEYKNALPEETETEAPQTEAPQTEAPQTEVTQTEAKQTEAPATKETETEKPATKETEAVTTSTSVLLLKGSATKKTVTLTWNKVKNADGYIIYGAACGSKFEELGTVTGRKNNTWKQKKLNASTGYKFKVKAYKEVNGKKKTLLKSNVIRVQTKGGKYTNVNKVKVSSKQVTLGVGEKQKIKVKTELVNEKKKLKKSMSTITYLSSDTSVAKVSAKGRITAVGKGSCYVYAIAADGARKKITVTVN